MNEVNLTEQELKEAETMANSIVMEARNNRTEEIKPKQIMGIPIILREALKMHLCTFKYQTGERNSTQTVVAQMIAATVATTEDLFKTKIGYSDSTVLYEVFSQEVGE